MHVLYGFTIVRPEFESTQEAAFEWLALAHTQAEAKRCAQKKMGFEPKPFEDTLRKALKRYGCGSGHMGLEGTGLEGTGTRRDRLSVAPGKNRRQPKITSLGRLGCVSLHANCLLGEGKSSYWLFVIGCWRWFRFGRGGFLRIGSCLSDRV
ncbi:MAG: hypothetical protein WCI20_03775 [bacterium]